MNMNLKYIIVHMINQNINLHAVHVFHIGELKVFANTKAHVMKAVMMNDD